MAEEEQDNHCHVFPSKFDVKEKWMNKSVKRVLHIKTHAAAFELQDFLFPGVQDHLS